MSTQPIALIIGAGPNIGQHAADTLVSKGYKVALASRSAKQDDSDSNQFNFQVDLANPSSIPELFSKVKAALGAPSVVIYNGECVSVPNLTHTNHVLQPLLQAPTIQRTSSLFPWKSSQRICISTLLARTPPRNKPPSDSNNFLSRRQERSFTPEMQ
jgi:NAD(P)-dependent dehydrogenase (short-subunit alcohol dehydrogenase family)